MAQHKVFGPIEASDTPYNQQATPCLFVADNTTIVFNLFCSFFLIIFLHRAHLNEPQFAAQSSPKVETTSQQSFFYITIAHNIKLARQENAAAT